MGIQGLSTFVRARRLFDPHHRLHDTVLVVDGHNLLYKLYFKYQREKRNSHMYGGDYALFAAHVADFFGRLAACSVVPIVVFDGSFDPSLAKLETLLKRFGDSLQQAYRLYAHNTFDEGLLPLLNEAVFQQTLRTLGVCQLSGLYEADDLVRQIAGDLRCPVLSNDSDFLVEPPGLLSGGVISLDFLLDDDFRVLTSEEEEGETPYKYISCYIYRAAHLLRVYPKLKLELLPVVGALLGNDHISQAVANVLQRRIPRYSGGGMANLPVSNRQKRIHAVFTWLAAYDSLEELLADLRRILDTDPEHSSKLLLYIEKQFSDAQKEEEEEATKEGEEDFSKPKEAEGLPSLVQRYLAAHLERLCFFKRLNLPRWAHERLVSTRIPSRLLRLRELHIDWFRPLVEDFSIRESSAEVVYGLSQHVYGILRTSVRNWKTWTVCRRSSATAGGTRIEWWTASRPSPSLWTTNNNNQQQLLPTLEEVSSLSRAARYHLFLRIADIDPTTPQLLRAILSDHGVHPTATPLLQPFISALLALHYLTVHFCEPLWLEFPPRRPAQPPPQRPPLPRAAPVLLNRLEPAERKRLHRHFDPLSELPVLSHTRVFMPRLVHHYNALQQCFTSLSFLAAVLDVEEEEEEEDEKEDKTSFTTFNLRPVLTSLKGTLLYNLTADLAGRRKPLGYIVRDLLGTTTTTSADKNTPPSVLPSLFSQLLDFLVDGRRTKGRRLLLINSPEQQQHETKTSSPTRCQLSPESS
ncbi:Protein asteroid 1 [Tyrophagus putrescentiae]|nr:Protein asteroid 1 [Tyrophagus putrescentiae]